MEVITYYSRNGKKPPFEVTVRVDEKMVFINCNCELGVEKKICRHKINAIRADKSNRHADTSDEVILRLKNLFGSSSTARIHLEEKWRLLRYFADQHPDAEAEISKKRRLLGEAFADGFLNENVKKIRRQFSIKDWYENRTIHAKGLNCLTRFEYIDGNGEVTVRDVRINEVFSSNSRFYFLGFCSMDQGIRSFMIGRIMKLDFIDASKDDISTLLNIFFQPENQAGDETGTAIDSKVIE